MNRKPEVEAQLKEKAIRMTGRKNTSFYLCCTCSCVLVGAISTDDETFLGLGCPECEVMIIPGGAMHAHRPAGPVALKAYLQNLVPAAMRGPKPPPPSDPGRHAHPVEASTEEPVA